MQISLVADRIRNPYSKWSWRFAKDGKHYIDMLPDSWDSGQLKGCPRFVVFEDNGDDTHDWEIRSWQNGELWRSGTDRMPAILRMVAGLEYKESSWQQHNSLRMT